MNSYRILAAVALPLALLLSVPAFSMQPAPAPAKQGWLESAQANPKKTTALLTAAATAGVVLAIPEYRNAVGHALVEGCKFAAPYIAKAGKKAYSYFPTLKSTALVSGSAAATAAIFKKDAIENKAIDATVYVTGKALDVKQAYEQNPKTTIAAGLAIAATPVVAYVANKQWDVVGKVMNIPVRSALSSMSSYFANSKVGKLFTSPKAIEAVVQDAVAKPSFATKAKAALSAACTGATSFVNNNRTLVAVPTAVATLGTAYAVDLYGKTKSAAKSGFHWATRGYFKKSPDAPIVPAAAPVVALN